MNDPYADVYQSFERCLRRSDFLRRFYTIFTGSHPDIADRFRETNWERQIFLLRHGISASILYASGGGLGQDELERLRKTHGPNGYAIPDWMYDYWLDALIQTLSETDPQWSIELEQRWRQAMGIAIDHISGRAAERQRRGRKWFGRH